MRIFKYLYFIFFIAAVSCTQKNTIKVTEVNFTDEVSLQQNLVFSFNRAVVSDSSYDTWDSIKYFTFNPVVEGRYKWIAPDQLLFSPLEGFQPFTDYEVVLSKNINLVTTEKYSVKKQIFKFSTPPLQIVEMRPFWTSSQTGGPELHTFIEFNYSINSEELASLLNVTIDDGQVSYSIMGSGATTLAELSLNIQNPQTIKSSDLTVIIKPGLGCLNSENKTKEEIKFNVSLSGSQNLEIIDIVPEYNEGIGVIRVYTNQSLLNQNIESLVKITPPISCETTIHPDGFSLKGDFLQGSSYRITISPDLTGILGTKLGTEIVREITFGELTPLVAFDDQESIYLSTAGERNIGVRIINVPKVKMTVFKIFENNIIEYMRRGKSYDWYEENNTYYDTYTYPMDENYGQPVFTKVINTLALPRKGNINLLKINPSELKMDDQYKGIYVVKIESVNERYLTDAVMVSFSDIGLIVKEGQNNFMVFARSIITGKVMKDVVVDFVSTNNQKVFQTKTDANGMAWLKNTGEKIQDFKVAMITARYGEDFTFILLNDALVETSRFEVDGKRLDYQDYDIFIYGQRNLYRPGDSVYFNMVARTPDWKTPIGIPFKIKVISPAGREFMSIKKTLDKFGCAETKFYLPAGCNTGRYTFEVYSFDDVIQNTSSFSVEEFLPDRIKLNCKTDKTEYNAGETVNAHMDAFYFYGPPASGRKVEMELQLNRSAFYSREFQDYDFTIGGTEDAKLESAIKEGVIGSDGKFSASFTTPPFFGIGMLKASLFTSVFDDAGKSVNSVNSFILYTQKVFFGIRNGNSWIPTRIPTDIGFIALDKNGKSSPNAEARLLIKRKTWETVAEKVYNSLKYVSVARETTVMDKTIRLTGGRYNLPFIPAISGEYEIRIMPVNGDGYVTQTLYAYGSDASFSTFRVDKDGQIEIKADKESYKPGEKAQLLFTAPFSGDLFITVEQNEALEHHYLKLENKAAKLTLNLKDGFVPNIYISATAMIKPGSQSIPLMVAHGYQSVRVVDETRKLPVTIECASISASKQKQTISIKTLPDAVLTVSVVDEGILQITRYVTPDPYEYFYQKRALGVNSYDIYPWLYPEIRSNSSTGAAEPYDLGKRINPLTNRRVRLATFWSGNLKSDRNGNAKFTIDIPQFSGSLRVMVAAFKDASFGSAHKNIKVADKVVVTSAFPLFLSPGDKVEVPVSIANTTNGAVNLNINVVASGAVSVSGNYNKSIVIKGNEESKVNIPFVAKNESGAAKVVIEVIGKTEKFTEITELTVRPPSGLETLTQTGTIEGGSTKSIEIKHDFLQKSTSGNLIISKSPVIGLTRDLGYLISYPYGCTEQVISSVFPQLYLEDITRLVKSNDKIKSTGLNVYDGIKRIEQAQLPEGGWNLWPGMLNHQNWVTVYALNFLIEARKAGYEVNEGVLQKAIKFVEVISKSDAVSSYPVNQSANEQVVIRAYNRETIYALYVLALAGKPNVSSMNFYKARPQQLTIDCKYMLGAAFAFTGNIKACNALIPAWNVQEQKSNESGNSFSSEIRDLAISLNALIEADPGNLKINEMAKILTYKVQKAAYLTTQEASFAIMALGKLARYAQKSNIEYQVMENNKVLQDFTGKDVYLKNQTGGKWNIKTRNSGKAWYFAEVSGMSSTGSIKETDNVLKVSREFYTRDGKKINPSASAGGFFNTTFAPSGSVNSMESYRFDINDLVVVKITLETTIPNIDNIAVTDILPACFQIENQRLNDTRYLNWAEQISTPTYLDIRDDRIHLFTDIGKKTQTFYYQVRVTSKGDFKLGPVIAEAMYIPAYKSVKAGGTVKVN